MKIYHLPFCGWYNELGYTTSRPPGCVCGKDGIESPEELEGKTMDRQQVVELMFLAACFIGAVAVVSVAIWMVVK